MAFDSEIGWRVTLALMVVALAGVGLPSRLRADRIGGRVSRRDDPRWFWRGMGVVGPPVTFACLVFLLQPRWGDFATIAAPPWVRWLGAPVGLFGVGLFAWMFRHLGLNVTSTSVPRAQATLVTTGPYRWVRHPMYTAAFVLLVATTLLTANVAVAGGGAAGFVLLALRSRVEEERLVLKFGDAYRAYQRRTGRFLPRVGRRRS